MSEWNQSDSTSPGAHHAVSLAYRIGALSLDVSFQLAAPWTVLFGPSGSGKTTILRAIAGLIRPDAGRIVRYEQSGEFVLTDARTLVPPHRREVRYAPQRAALFPHLTVAQNVAYGADAASIADMMEIFGLEPLAAKMPAALSGGERQRVNLARAFAAADCRLERFHSRCAPKQMTFARFSPEHRNGGTALMLLDEPFAGLDSALRDRLLPRIRSWLAEHRIPALSVTHDVVEALQLKAEVITLSDGKVTGQGEAVQILAAERARLLQQLNSQ